MTFEHLFPIKYRSFEIVLSRCDRTCFLSKNGIQNILSLLTQYQQSARSLGNDFTKYIGITPKEYQTIVRLRKSSLDLNRGKNILHTALDLDYSIFKNCIYFLITNLNTNVLTTTFLLKLIDMICYTFKKKNSITFILLERNAKSHQLIHGISF